MQLYVVASRCVVELELILCPLGVSTSLAVPGADQLLSPLSSLPAFAGIWGSYFGAVLLTEGSRTWLHLSRYVEDLGLGSYRFTFRGCFYLSQKQASWVMAGAFGLRL